MEYAVDQKKENGWLREVKNNILILLISLLKRDRHALKECFEAIDLNHDGKLGIDELEDPFIGLGLAENREDVN